MSWDSVHLSQSCTRRETVKERTWLMISRRCRWRGFMTETRCGKIRCSRKCQKTGGVRRGRLIGPVPSDLTWSTVSRASSIRSKRDTRNLTWTETAQLRGPTCTWVEFLRPDSKNNKKPGHSCFLLRKNPSKSGNRKVFYRSSERQIKTDGSLQRRCFKASRTT